MASITSTVVPLTGGLISPPIGQSLFATPTTSNVAVTMTSSSMRDPVSHIGAESPLTSGDGSGGVRGVVVGNVGTSEDKGKQGAIPSGGPLKRKRYNEGEEEEEEPEQPGSSLEPPSSKKRHIRLMRQRVQVSASSSTAPDTQGTAMEGPVRKV